jgi:hypothetical protein
MSSHVIIPAATMAIAATHDSSSSALSTYICALTEAYRATTPLRDTSQTYP